MGRMENTAQRGLSKGDPKDRPTITAANREKRCRCGMGPDGEYGSERPVEGGTARQTYHNGSKSRKTLPVRNGAGWRIRFRKACRRGHCETALPQRQQITGNAAGAEATKHDNPSERYFSDDPGPSPFATTAPNHAKYCRCGNFKNRKFISLHK